MRDACGRGVRANLPRRQKSRARRVTYGALALALSAVVIGGGFAGSEPKPELQAQIERGRGIAVAHCSVCHAVGLDDPSPTRANANTAFRQLSERFPIPMLQEAARTGNISGHDEMPGFQFTMDEIEALLSYIDSLAPKSAHYVTR